VAFGDQPTASCLYRPELAGAQQVMAKFGEAANLARAARTGTTGIATATLTAHFHTMEALALARLGDARGCDRALAEAVRGVRAAQAGG
jgi:hypothetical protein